MQPLRKQLRIRDVFVNRPQVSASEIILIINCLQDDEERVREVVDHAGTHREVVAALMERVKMDLTAEGPRDMAHVNPVLFNEYCSDEAKPAQGFQELIVIQLPVRLMYICRASHAL